MTANGAQGPNAMARDDRDLQAYYDGELRGLSRWWFARRLARSAELRGQLEELEAVGSWVRESAVTDEGPDLWPSIAMRLPAVDAQRSDEAASPVAGPRWFVPALAAGTAALALAVVLGIMDDGAPKASGVISWLDTGGRNVFVLDGAEDSTIVWLLDSPAEGASRGGTREAV